MRAAERIFSRGYKPNSSDKGICLAIVITDIEPDITILVKGDTMALPLDYFVVPEGLKFKKDETLLALPIVGVDSTNKRFVLKPLQEPLMMGLYTGGSYDIFDTNISLPAENVFCPYPVVPGITKCMILANRFPRLPEYTSFPNPFPTGTPEESKYKKTWAVVNTW